MMIRKLQFVLACIVILAAWNTARAESLAFSDQIYNPGRLKPIDSSLKVQEGQQAPDFTLPAIDGREIRLSDFRGKHNVMISFVPAAWTPVCSDQWPGYNLAEDLFTSHNTMLIGISTDNAPTLWAWTRQMGKLWFPVVSDFWPHGKVADQYGVLRSDGTADRALIFVDMKGIISHIEVSDINVRPKLETIAAQLEKLQSR